MELTKQTELEPNEEVVVAAPVVQLLEDEAILRMVSKPCLEFTDELVRLFKQLEKTMIANQGVGLAAIQIGVPARACVVRTRTGILRMANPRIVDVSPEKTYSGEGCLSLLCNPRLTAGVHRANDVTVAFQTETGEARTMVFEGLEARIIQHEIDHLEGKLFVDRLSSFTKAEKLKKYRLSKARRG